ncbi:MAG: ATP-dependent helicase/nuclease subunit B [Chitinophagales bacterium]|jgi:ATP-dependent helicase/nuclease subunit B
MEDKWLSTLDQDSAVIVPTRSLANQLNERVARYFVASGQSVWVAPTILVWPDYLRQLWQLNRESFSQKFNVHSLINAQQSMVLWTQIIEISRRNEHELNLLNVQQTTRAVQRSWKLMHDWNVSASQLKQDHVADTEQFVLWAQSYQELLNKRGIFDEQLLLSALLDEPNAQHPFTELHLVSYDLLTAAQQKYLSAAEQSGVSCNRSQPLVAEESTEYLQYENSKTEITVALEYARRCLENDLEHTISLVIPDLAQRHTQVQELAREVFYPSASPLSVQQNNCVYGFSLGQPLFDLPAIEAALRVISLLKNRTNTIEFSFLLRNRFLGFSAEHREQGRLFEQWLKRNRLHSFSFDQLPLLYQQCLDYFAKRDHVIDGDLLAALERLVESRQVVQHRLTKAKQASAFAALSFTDWVQVFSDWLSQWQWNTATEGAQLNSVQYQLQTRWQALLEEFASLATVQKRAGLTRSFELLQQMARNTVFLPKSADSPILISGVFDAIGREVDTCIVTGMHQDYPAPPSTDAFISNRFLLQSGHPQSTAESGFVHAQSVISNLLSCAKNRRISYPSANDQNREISMQPSSLFRGAAWLNQTPIAYDSNQLKLEAYEDIQGPPWLQPGRAKGGSKIFENQSNCAFKAFATHQLGFLEEAEAEFGLDGLDRGNVVHQLLDMLWQRLQNQIALSEMDASARLSLVSSVIEDCFQQGTFKLTQDKTNLLKHEKARLQNLLLAWLKEEDKRPTNFSVIEREEQREGELGGIRYRYVIDRLDVTDDGRSVIIDYKTGTVNRNDWTGERIKSPQMPLYALALDRFKNKPVAGIAFAQVKSIEPKFIELSETDVFRKTSHHTVKYQNQWLESRAAWPAIFEQLAKDFLSGQAMVNPIDESTCQYCELTPFCRVSQLRSDHATEQEVPL